MPKRPNAIDLSIVSLTVILENTLDIGDVDILDGTPLLDIKPSVPTSDSYCEVKAGWFDKIPHNALSGSSNEWFRQDTHYTGLKSGHWPDP